MTRFVYHTLPEKYFYKLKKHNPTCSKFVCKAEPSEYAGKTELFSTNDTLV